MQETRNLLVDNIIFNKMMDTSITLVESIRAKQGQEGAVITEEGANFANAFIAYAGEIKKALERQQEEE